MFQNTSLLLIGCGKMGGSILNGLLKNGFPTQNIRVAEPNETVRKALTEKGIRCAADASALTDFDPDIVFLAVKPFLIEQVITGVKPFTDKGSVILSIIAGRKIGWFKEKLGTNTVVFRAMPNTPAAIGKGITGVTSCGLANEEQKKKDIEDIQSKLVNITDDELFLKAELIKSFLSSILPALKEEDSIDEAFDKHMNKERQKEIEKFATENSINLDTLETIINEFEYSGIFPDALIGQSIEAPFLKKISIIENIKGFVKNLLKKYM